jgi:hypothetical protein
VCVRISILSNSWIWGSKSTVLTFGTEDALMEFDIRSWVYDVSNYATQTVLHSYISQQNHDLFLRYTLSSYYIAGGVWGVTNIVNK